MLKDVGILGRARRLLPAGAVLQGSAGRILAFFTGSAFFTSATWGYLAWAVAFGCCWSSAS